MTRNCTVLNFGGRSEIITGSTILPLPEGARLVLGRRYARPVRKHSVTPCVTPPFALNKQ